MDYNARYYSPVLGRFVSPDTIIPNPIDSQQFNRYAYANNNSVKNIDPSGHSGGLSDFLLGVVYEITSNNYDGLLIPSSSPLRANAEALAASQTDNVAFQGGRIVGGVASAVQGAVEIVGGAGTAVGGVGGGIITSPSGVGAIAGGAVAVAGVAVAAHGAGTFFHGIVGASEAGQNIFKAVTDGGGGGKNNPLDGLTEIGRPGRGKGVRNVVGEAEDARNLFDKLTEGAEIGPHPNPDIEGGLMAQLPDGGVIGFRPTSGSGEPTIDINIPDRSDLPRKIKFVER